MKKLIAQRPIQYIGRICEHRTAIPAQDTKMVAAWLKAGSAVWAGDTRAADASEDTRDAIGYSIVNDLAAQAIRDMGVTIEDADGKFVRVVSIENQLHAIFAGGRRGRRNT